MPTHHPKQGKHTAQMGGGWILGACEERKQGQCISKHNQYRPLGYSPGECTFGLSANWKSYRNASYELALAALKETGLCTFLVNKEGSSMKQLTAAPISSPSRKSLQLHQILPDNIILVGGGPGA